MTRNTSPGKLTEHYSVRIKVPFRFRLVSLFIRLFCLALFPFFVGGGGGGGGGGGVTQISVNAIAFSVKSTSSNDFGHC